MGWAAAIALAAGMLLALCPGLSAFRIGCQLSFRQQWRLASSARPTLDDVEKISYGQAAKRRGTGSRNVPHRLNAMERKEWDLAKRRRYLLVRGSGWRKERGDSPLVNIYRQLCDALAVPSISVARGLGAGPSAPLDVVTVDLSPLRTLDVDQQLADIRAEAARPELYSSLVSIEDNLAAAAAALSPYDAPQVFAESQIWKIAAFGATVTFGKRADAKAFAESVAKKLAGGQAALLQHKTPGGGSEDDGEEDED